uniref:VPS37 C-terminal domain-containing protein n=1 Tax=Gasterosteus aculeatus aculeatus TaxID=481459 RepID=A0AAQ4R7W5_GASAC
LQVDRETLQATNRRLAEDSLARQPRLCNGKVQLAEKYRELSNLATACREKRSQLGEFEPALMRQKGEGGEGDELLEKFMEGTASLDHFLDSFQSSRKTYHVRRAQAEKMQEAARAKRPASRAKGAAAEESGGVKRDSEPRRLNGFVAQGPLRVFQVRYGLTPAILLPHHPVSPPASAPSCAPPAEPQPGHAHVLANPMAGHGQPVGLRVIGQLPGGWPANGRPVRMQQLYRPNPQQPEPPYR